MDELNCFIHRLGSSLSRELNETKRHVDEETLLKSFQTTIASLPSCHIKEEIEKDLEKYFEKFKTYALESNSHHRGLEFDLANEDSLLGVLLTIENDTSIQDKTSMYSKLLLCCAVSCPSKIPAVLEQWAKTVTTTYTSIDALEVLQVAICLVLPRLSDPSPVLKFILHIVTYLIGNCETLHKADHQFLSLLLNVLFHSVTVTIHGLPPVGSGCYGNELAALLSICMELSIHLKTEAVPLENPTRLILVALGSLPRLILDVPLQMDSSSQSTAEFTTLLSFLYNHVVTNHSLLIQQESSMYLKVYCSLLLLSDTVHYIIAKKQFDCLTAPVDFSSWVWAQNPEICKLLNFKREWSSKQLKKFMIASVVAYRKELDHLLDLLNGISVVSSTTPLPPPVQLPGNTSSNPVNVTSDHPTQSNATNECLYFVDSEGSQEARLSPGKGGCLPDSIEDQGEEGDNQWNNEVTPFVTRVRSMSILPGNTTVTTANADSANSIAETEVSSVVSPTTSTKPQTNSLLTTIPEQNELPFSEVKKPQLSTPRVRKRKASSSSYTTTSSRLTRSATKRIGLTLGALGQVIEND